MQVGQKIKKLRELKNYTQEYMADKLDMTQPSYSKIETGETDISYGKLEKIADVLQLRPEDIVAFNEHLVFNIMHNQTVNGVHGSHLYFIPEEIRKLHEAQVNSLKEEIVHLKSVLDKVLSK
jgi:transcriptional regulator with XRE-family HTH domain